MWGILRRSVTLERPAGKPDDAPLDDPQPLVPAELEAFGKEELETQADPEKRPAGPDEVEDRLGEAGAVEVLHAVGKCPHTGKHHSRAVGDDAGVRGDDRVGPDLLERLGDAPQVSHPVVDDGDQSSPRRMPRSRPRRIAASRPSAPGRWAAPGSFVRRPRREGSRPPCSRGTGSIPAGAAAPGSRSRCRCSARERCSRRSSRRSTMMTNWL